MKKILLIASREFIATVSTKAFIIGLLIMPLMIGVAAIVFPRLLNPRNFKTRGEVAIIDPQRPRDGRHPNGVLAGAHGRAPRRTGAAGAESGARAVGNLRDGGREPDGRAMANASTRAPISV